MFAYTKKLLLVLIMAFISTFAVGCAQDYGANPITNGPDKTYQPTSPGARVEQQFVRAGHSIGYSMAWFILACLIAGIPLAIIFLVPGAIFGRAEQPVEGGLMVGFGVLALTTLSAPTLGLTWAVVLVNLVPGALLFLKGLVSEDEEGKLAIVLVPTLLMIGFLLIKAVGGLINGLLESPFSTIGLIVLVLFFLGGAVSRASK